MPDTICHKFLETSKKFSERTALLFKRGNRWIDLDWQSYAELVRTIAAGLQTIGVRKRDKVAILSNTRYEWAASDLAILGLGAVTVPIYQSSTPEDIGFILHNSEAKVLICENAATARRAREALRRASANSTTLQQIICIDPPRKGEKRLTDEAERVLSFAELQAKGETALKKSPTLYELAVQELAMDDSATVVYTSGTTGSPRGVLLSHTQVMSEVSDAFPLLGVTVRDRSLTFLPYAHILGRIEIWGHALIGYTAAFAQSIDKLKDDLAETKPTLIVSVPRVFEKIYNGILAQSEISQIRSRAFQWALEIGRDISRYKIEKQSPPMDLALKYQLARRLVFNPIAKRLGGNLRFAVCGGAPLSQPIAEFFHAAGLLILEGYGLTETTAAITVNTPFDYRFGTVGKPVGDVRIKIADDGEILVQSKKVMKAYHRDVEGTASSIIDGWLHTGDIGELTSEGYLRITDRKKDLIKTAGGKYVAPQRLEGLLKASRFISQVHIHGDQRKYVVALLALNFDAVEAYADESGIAYKNRSELIESAKIKELIRQAVADANSHLASYESIKSFAILPRELTIEEGELTPSLKIKRKVVEQRYREMIESLY